MAIDTKDLDRGVKVLRDHGARRVILFGSALDSPERAMDLDLGCEGVEPERFYLAAGELLDVVGKPVDLVDLSVDSRLTRYIRAHGRVLYDA